MIALRNSSRHALMALATVACGACIAEQSPLRTEIDKDRVQAQASQFRTRVGDKVWEEPAASLTLLGDRMYRRKDYRGAQKQYRDAYPNLPNPTLFVLAADSQLRAVVKQNAPHASDPANCLRNGEFVVDLRTELTEVYSFGMALADAIGESPRMTPVFRQHAAASEVCLWNLLGLIEAQPREECVNILALKSCLGTPLVR